MAARSALSVALVTETAEGSRSCEQGDIRASYPYTKAATAAGSARPPASRASGSGRSHGISVPATTGASGSLPGPGQAAVGHEEGAVAGTGAGQDGCLLGAGACYGPEGEGGV